MRKNIWKVAMVAATLIGAITVANAQNEAMYVGTPEWRAYVDRFGGLEKDDTYVIKDGMVSCQGQAIGGWKATIKGTAGSNGTAYYGGLFEFSKELNKSELGVGGGIFHMKDFEEKPFQGYTLYGFTKFYFAGIHKKYDGKVKKRDILRFYGTLGVGATQGRNGEAAQGEGWTYNGRATKFYAHGEGRLGGELRGFASPWRLQFEVCAKYIGGNFNFKSIENGQLQTQVSRTTNKLFIGVNIGVSYVFQKKGGFVVEARN